MDALERFSHDTEMKTSEQNRHNKRTEIEQFDWFAISTKSSSGNSKAHSQTRKYWGREWLVCRTDTNARSFTLGWKNFMPEGLSRNQSILRFDVILQHDWPIEKCLLHIGVFFGRETKSPCFDLFTIHWLIKQNKEHTKIALLAWTRQPDSSPVVFIWNARGEQ